MAAAHSKRPLGNPGRGVSGADYSSNITPEVTVENATRHARIRAQQRSIRLEQIDIVLAYGACIKQPEGRRAYHLGRREVALARKAGVELEGLCGLIVVVARDGALVTLIRSDDRRRLKRYGQRWRRRSSRRRRRWRHHSPSAHAASAPPFTHTRRS